MAVRFAGALYVAYEVVSGHYRTVLFRPRDVPGAWRMLASYLWRRRESPPYDTYNPLQRLAYTLIVLAGIGSVLTGVALCKPMQAEWLTQLLEGDQ